MLIYYYFGFVLTGTFEYDDLSIPTIMNESIFFGLFRLYSTLNEFDITISIIVFRKHSLISSLFQ